jgi:Cys-rich repeat protein
MKTTMSWALVLSALVSVGCTNGSGPTLARPNTQLVKSQSRQALGGTGLAASAQFDAPVIDANTQSPSSPGTGTFSVAPNLTGGNGSLGVVDASSSPTFNYVIVGDLNGNPASFFAVIADVPFTVGTVAIDNVHFYAGLFDTATGNPTHLATGGSVTFSTAGGIGGRWVGSFTGTVDEVAPQCQSSADCATGEVCSNGTCVRAPPPQCSASNPCAAGQTCQAGVCVPVSTGCVVDADCNAGQSCVSGQCVFGTLVCQADSDCAAGEQCLRGTCVAPQPQCTSNTQCPAGWLCQGGQCTPGGTTGSQCDGQQGAGSLSGSVTAVATCAAIPSGAVSLTQGMAAIDDQLRLFVFNPNSPDEGAILELALCPGATGTLSLGNGLVSASHIKDVQTPDLRLYAERKASSATLTLTRIAPSLAGSFSMTLSAGGNVTGNFTMQ